MMIGFIVGFALLLQAQVPAQHAIVLPTIDGKKLHIVGTQNGLKVLEYPGKVLFIEFWGTGCPPCRMSIPHYIQLQKKYKDKLAIVTVEVWGTPKEKLKTFVKREGINYDVASYGDGAYFVRYLTHRSGWEGSVPFLAIFDRNGDFVTMQVGLLNAKALDGLVAKLSSMPLKVEKKSPAQNTSSQPTPSENNTTKSPKK